MPHTLVIFKCMILADKLLNQELTKRILCKITLKLALSGNRNNAGLLGYDNDDRVAYLTETNCRAVSCTKLALNVRMLWQRKNTGRSLDTVVLDNHSTVVKRSFVKEQVSDEVVGDVCIDNNTESINVIIFFIMLFSLKRKRTNY